MTLDFIVSKLKCDMSKTWLHETYYNHKEVQSECVYQKYRLPSIMKTKLY